MSRPGWTLEPANKSYGKWKPFYYRARKSGQEQATDSPDHPQRVLSPKSINYAKTVIASCMEWLVKQNYLKYNNFQDIPSIKFAQTKLQTQNRAFTLKQMQLIFAYAGFPLKPGHLIISKGYELHDSCSFAQAEVRPFVRVSRKTNPGVRFQICALRPLYHLHV